MLPSTAAGSLVSPEHTMFMFTLLIFGFCVTSVIFACTLEVTAFQSTVCAGADVSLSAELLSASGAVAGAGVTVGCGVTIGAGVTSPVLFRYISSQDPQAPADAVARIPTVTFVPSSVISIFCTLGLLQFFQPFNSPSAACVLPSTET